MSPDDPIHTPPDTAIGTGSGRARLTRALALLERRGITGGNAYPPLHRGLARLGVIRPSPPFGGRALSVITCVTMFIVFGGVMAGTALLVRAIGVLPAPMRALLAAGPTVFVIVTAALSATFTVLALRKTRRSDLPRRDEVQRNGAPCARPVRIPGVPSAMRASGRGETCHDARAARQGVNSATTLRRVADMTKAPEGAFV